MRELLPTRFASANQLHRWDDDVVFRNQARGTENKGKKEFVNVSNRPVAIADKALELIAG